MKDTEQCFPVILLSMIQKEAPVFDSLGEILLCVQSNERNWAVLFYGTVYYAVGGSNLIESVDEILRCDHSNESYSVWAVLSCGTVSYALQGGSQPRPQVFSPTERTLGTRLGGSNFSVFAWNAHISFKWRLMFSTLLRYS